MPRFASPKTSIHHAHSPLLFRAQFNPELIRHVVDLGKLPWRITYPPHGDGTPAKDTSSASQGSVSQSPTMKMTCPKGEPGQRNSVGGWQLKESMGLLDMTYNEMLVSILLWPPLHFFDLFIGLG